MKLSVLAALATLTLVTCDLSAQRRGRFGRDGQGGPPGAPPAPSVTETAKEGGKPKSHTAIVGGDVYLGTGQRMTGATVLVGDDKIVAVGHNLQLPEGTKIIDAKGKTVSPGFVCVVGNGMGQGRGAPWIDSVNPFDPEIKQALAAGITAFLAGTPGGGPLPTGDTAVIKTAWGDVKGMVLAEGSVLGMSAQLSPSDRERFQDLVKKVKEYQRALEEFPAKKAADANAKAPEMPQGGESIQKILDGRSRLWVQLGGGGFNPFGGRRIGASNDLTSIRAANDIAGWLGTGVVLQKPISAWLCADEIANTGSMVVLSPRDRVPPEPQDPERSGSSIASAAILAEAGVPVAVTCPVGGYGGGPGVTIGGIMGQDLNTPHIDAAFTVRGGLDNRRALRTLTIDAARILGVDNRIGSLAAGKDADILILDGDPLHYRTFVQTALVNGKVVYEKDKEPFYSHIQR
jgi:hypothetical protein